MQGDFPIVRPLAVLEEASGTAYSPFQGCVRKDLHFFHLWRNRKEFAGPRSQCLRDLASQVGIAARFICRGVEDAKLPRPELERIPFQCPFFIQSEWLADFRNASASASLPARASSVTNNPIASIDLPPGLN